MIIPVRCFTCGEVLADKWIPYITAIQDDKNKINAIHKERIEVLKDVLDTESSKLEKK